MTYEPLAPCPACQRHVRVRESRCPFCRASLPEWLASKVIPGARTRLSRSAVAVFATALAASCTNGASPATRPLESVSGAEHRAAADAGAPPAPDAHLAGPDDNGASNADYGAPVYIPDAGEARPASVDAGAPPRRVGRTPRRPRPPSDDGNVQPLYGVSPKI